MEDGHTCVIQCPLKKPWFRFTPSEVMFKVIFFLSCVVILKAQVIPRVDYADNSVPTPYQFSYTAPADGGSSSHQETGDGNGRVTGSYSLEDEDGRSRIVEYVADEDGFRASISTNEPGTSNQNPADVSIASSAEDGQGGSQVLQSPPATVAAIAPVARVTPTRLARPPAPAPISRPALVPFQPALVPVQPALDPFEPRLVPVQPAFDSRRFIIEPGFPSFGSERFISGASLVPVGSRRFAEPSVLVPINDARLVRDPFYSRNFFRSFDRREFI